MKRGRKNFPISRFFLMDLARSISHEIKTKKFLCEQVVYEKGKQR